MLNIRVASKSRRQPRGVITGISGGGKTRTMLEFLYACQLRREDFGLTGEHILILDTEKDSASLYSSGADPNTGLPNPTNHNLPDGPQFGFYGVDVIEETGSKFSLDWLSARLKWLRNEGINEYGICALGIDSLSHFWFGNGGALDEVELIAKARYKGDSYRAWGDITPKVNAVIDEIIALPIPVMVSVHSKHAYERTETVVNGKKKTTIARVGDAPVFRRDLLYEFDVGFVMTPQDTKGVLLSVDKTRYGGWDGVVQQDPDYKFFDQYLDWLCGTTGEVPKHQYYYADGEEIPHEKASARRVFSMYRAANNGAIPESKDTLMSWYENNHAQAAANVSVESAESSE